MTPLLTQADLLLRPAAGPADARQLSPARALLILALFGSAYGACMGTFFEEDGAPRALQAAYSATKVPLLLILTFVLALPSFYVVNMLVGLGGDFPEALRALLSTQAGLTVILASLAPFTLFFYASSTQYDGAILFNAAMFAVASVASQRLLKRAYAPLIARDPRHRRMVRVWLVVYAFVGIQMGWVLRPFIGQPGVPTTFFRAGAWGNAYVEVWEKVSDVWTGRRAWERRDADR
ncbi:MAG: hypothetical protein ACAI43_15685 [Phycisphaerae bacterium]|nr:hypothetical protein [Tepidisphaeraceae bacterium]